MTRYLEPVERIPVSIARFVRLIYATPGRQGKRYYRDPWTLLTEPLITEIFTIPDHWHVWNKWTHEDNIGNPSNCSICWGQTHIVKLVYATSGYGADIGGHFDEALGKWQWTVWAD